MVPHLLFTTNMHAYINGAYVNGYGDDDVENCDIAMLGK